MASTTPLRDLLTTKTASATINGYWDIDCNPSADCSLAALYYQGAIYVAFADAYSRGLDILKGTLENGGQGKYQFTVVHQDTTYTLTSAPAMVVTPDGALMVRYGTSNNPSYKNAGITTVLRGGTWTNYAGSNLCPTQSAIVNFNGVIYAIDKQDNSSDGVFVSKLDNNGVQISGTLKQIPGWYTHQGIGATVFNGNIVAVIQANSNGNNLYVFSSPDGSNWYAQEYSNLLNYTPAVTLFNGGIALATTANDSSYTLYAAFSTN